MTSNGSTSFGGSQPSMYSRFREKLPDKPLLVSGAVGGPCVIFLCTPLRNGLTLGAQDKKSGIAGLYRKVFRGGPQSGWTGGLAPAVVACPQFLAVGPMYHFMNGGLMELTSASKLFCSAVASFGASLLETGPGPAGRSRDNFLSAAVLGNMVSLGSDAANAGMMAVRHARIIQQLILASGNEASKAYEKWQRRGKASVFSRKDVDDLQNDVRKAGNKLQQKRRANLLQRLSTEALATGLQTQDAFGSRRSMTETPKPEARQGERGLRRSASLSRSLALLPRRQVPGLGFMRMAGRRASFTASENPVNLVAQRRIAVRQPSLLQQPALGQLVRQSMLSPGGGGAGGSAGATLQPSHPTGSEAALRPKRQSQWGQLAGLARLLIPKDGSAGEAVGPGSSISAAPDESGRSDVEQSDTQDEGINEGRTLELTPAQRRKLPEVFGISKFRDRSEGGGEGDTPEQEPAPTLKRFHLEVAERLGLDADAGDWDPGLTYEMSVGKLEELAERKILRHQDRAATRIQSRWRSYRIRLPMRQAILQRRRVADRMSHLRFSIQAAITIQAQIRRWRLQRKLSSARALHRVQYRMSLLSKELLAKSLRAEEAGAKAGGPALQVLTFGSQSRNAQMAMPWHGLERRGAPRSAALRRSKTRPPALFSLHCQVQQVLCSLRIRCGWLAQKRSLDTCSGHVGPWCRGAPDPKLPQRHGRPKPFALVSGAAAGDAGQSGPLRCGELPGDVQRDGPGAPALQLPSHEPRGEVSELCPQGEHGAQAPALHSLQGSLMLRHLSSGFGCWKRNALFSAAVQDQLPASACDPMTFADELRAARAAALDAERRVGTGRPTKQARLEVPRAVDPNGPSTPESTVQPSAIAAVGAEAHEADELIEEAPRPPEEQARERFARRLAGGLDEASLPSLLLELQTEAPSWGSTRRLRSVALLLVYVSRSSRVCRGAFVAQGLPLLGELMTESVQVLEAGPDTERQEAGLRTVASLSCLNALAVGRATMWEHRQILGKAFDRLHRWCSQERTALAAELRAPTQSLSRRWRQQPKPAVQDTPANKALRVKVLELIRQGLEDGAGSRHATVASEIEAALYALYAGASSDYRQHARMLRHNMIQPENGALRRRLLTGEIGAQDLVRMDSRSLAPETLQEQRRREELEALKSVVIAEAKSPAAAPPSFDWRDETYNPSAREEEDAGARQVQSQAQLESSAEFMEQPTPLRTSSQGNPGQGGASQAPSTPEAMATPAPEDDDEQGDDLIRHFSQRVPSGAVLRAIEASRGDDHRFQPTASSAGVQLEDLTRGSPRLRFLRAHDGFGSKKFEESPRVEALFYPKGATAANGATRVWRCDLV
eukprot:s2446_g1.t7